MSGQTCALEGCSKACAGAEHLACGELHHLLLMAGRYDSAPPHPYQLILERNALGHCAFASCSKAPWSGHPWCSRTHYLSWLSSFYASLSPLQICKLPGCTRHIYVSDSDSTPPSQFCGWSHCQKFTMLNALSQHHHHQPPSTQTEYGYVPSMKSFMHALKHFALNGVSPKSIRVDNDFFTKHPWEVLAESNTCYLIAQLRRKNKQRDMVTKDQYHWKQQGPPKVKSGYCRKYFSYMKLKGKKEEAVQHYDEGSYTMKEYVMDNVDSYGIVRICKGGKKVCKSRKRRKREDDIECSQGSVTSILDSWNHPFVIEPFEELFSVDDFFADLPPF